MDIKNFIPKNVFPLFSGRATLKDNLIQIRNSNFEKNNLPDYTDYTYYVYPDLIILQKIKQEKSS